MENHIGKELKQAVKSLQVKTAVSKEGSPYTYISLLLVNGYEKRIYTQQAEEFAFRNAFDQLATTQQVDAIL